MSSMSPLDPADFEGERDTTTREHHVLCYDAASKLFSALERGYDYYKSKVMVHQRNDERTHAGSLLAVIGEMLSRRHATTEMLAVLLFSARRVDEYPTKLRAFFDEFIRHPALDLPRELARSCHVPPSWFNRWARDYHQAGGVDIPWADDQAIRSGLSALVDNFLASRSSVNEVIELLEHGVMHFFKVVVDSQKDQPSVDPEILAATVVASNDAAEAPTDDHVKVLGELWYRLVQTISDSNPVWRPSNAWLTAALIDLGSDPLPTDAQEALERCPSAAREMKQYWSRFVADHADQVDRTKLPRDSRVRLRVSLAVLADMLELGAPVRLHDRIYQKHKRAVRLVSEVIRSYRNELAQREAAAPERQRGDD